MDFYCEIGRVVSVTCDRDMVKLNLAISTFKDSPARDWAVSSIKRIPGQKGMSTDQFKELTMKLSLNAVRPLL